MNDEDADFLRDASLAALIISAVATLVFAMFLYQAKYTNPLQGLNSIIPGRNEGGGGDKGGMHNGKSNSMYSQNNQNNQRTLWLGFLFGGGLLATSILQFEKLESRKESA
jgi:hypothetical protein